MTSIQGLLAAVALGAIACTPPPLSLPAPAPPPLPGPERLVEAAVAAVDADVITLSEVRLGCDLNRLRDAPGPIDPDRLGPCPPEAETETVDQLVNQALIVEDAARFDIEVPPQEVARRLDLLRARLAGPDGLERFLARHDLDRAALEARIGREVLLGRYLERRIGLLVVVTPDEVDRYYQEHRAEFADAPRAAADAEIRQYLQRLKYRDALAEYIASLRARAEVRRLRVP